MGTRNVIPTFKLYGEVQLWARPDALHCESIASRSRLHDWRIERHRHADLVQILYVRRGAARLQVDGQITTLEGPAVQVLPAACIHAFEFAEDIDGQILTLAMPQVSRLRQRCQSVAQGLFNAAALLTPDEAQAETFDALMRQLATEYAGRGVGREIMLDALLDRLAICLLRLRPDDAQTTMAVRGVRHLAGYVELVEQHYREQWSVERYAATLGITAVHLASLCQHLAASTALAIVHQRVILEAKRQLRYSRLPVARIANELGFTDPGYFARFFRRKTGMSPGAYRQQAIEEAVNQA